MLLKAHEKEFHAGMIIVKKNTLGILTSTNRIIADSVPNISSFRRRQRLIPNMFSHHVYKGMVRDDLGTINREGKQSFL